MTAIIGGFRGKSHVSLGKQNFSAGGSVSFKIPQDIVVKEFIVVANGTVTCTFSGTKPTVNPYGVLNGLIAEMSLSRRGTDRLRSYKGTRHLIHTSERQFGQSDPIIYKNTSSTLSGTVLTGLLVHSATGVASAFRESVSIPLENKLSGDWYPTLFNTKGLQTAVLNMSFNQVSAIQDPEDANVGTYAASIEIEVFASCSDYLLDDPNANLADWNQNFEELEFSGAQTGSRKYITPQGMLQGILITGLYGGSKPFDFENMKNTKIELKYQGVSLCEGTLADYLEIDMQKTNLSSRKKGSAYISFLNNKAFDSGLYISEGKQIELIISTDAAMSYASPVKLVFEYDQIIFAPTQPKQVA